MISLRKNNKNSSSFHSKGNDSVLMLFDLSIRGHHPAYIRHLIHFFISNSLPGKLIVVVSPRFLEEHNEVVKLAHSAQHNKVVFHAITATEEDSLGRRKNSLQRLLRTFREWKLLCRYAESFQIDHCLAMYLDTCLRPLALYQAPPCAFSGIYFRPTFHYPYFSSHQVTIKSTLQHQWEKFILRLAGRPSRLDRIFSLDPFAVPLLNSLMAETKAVHLPDPVVIDGLNETKVQEVRTRLKVDSQRIVTLCFGALTKRKGVPQLLEAIKQLSWQDCRKLCLVLIGESNIQDELEEQINALVLNQPVQILRHYEFVSEADVASYFQLADIVLAPYQRHIGMSGILLQAAAAGKPVLSSDYGLMGELVMRYQLGLAVDTTQPDKIADGLHYFLNTPLKEIGDRTSMRIFAEENSADLFSQTIFDHLLSTGKELEVD